MCAASCLITSNPSLSFAVKIFTELSFSIEMSIQYISVKKFNKIIDPRKKLNMDFVPVPNLEAISGAIKASLA